MNDVKIIDNSDKVLDEFERKKKLALKAIGMAAERHAKKDPNMPVDTGRARNSITWASKEREGEIVSFKYSQEVDGKKIQITDTTEIGSGISDDDVYIGSNVEYFPAIELGSRTIKARHVLKNAAANHSDEYKKLTKQALES